MFPAPPKEVRPPRRVTGVVGGRERWWRASLGTMGKHLLTKMGALV